MPLGASLSPSSLGRYFRLVVVSRLLPLFCLFCVFCNQSINGTKRCEDVEQEASLESEE